MPNAPEFVAHLAAKDIIRQLNMSPHPEGGHFVEIYRDGDGTSVEQRGAASSIYFLLQRGERSHWHRVTDAAEIWAWHGGAPLELSIAVNGDPIETSHLGLDFSAGHRPQAIVPAGAWQAARSLGDWSLVGCVVAPGFLFDRFELAPPGWTPGS